MKILELISSYESDNIVSGGGFKGGGSQESDVEVATKVNVKKKRDVFRKEAETIKDQKKMAMWFCFAMIAATFLLMVYIIVQYRDDKSMVVGFLCGEGALAFFLINRSLSLFKEIDVSILLEIAASKIKTEADFLEFINAIKLKMGGAVKTEK